LKNSEIEILKLLFEKFNQLNFRSNPLIFLSQTVNQIMQLINLAKQGIGIFLNSCEKITIN